MPSHSPCPSAVYPTAARQNRFPSPHIFRATAKPENKAAYATYRAFTDIHAGDIDTALDELEGVADGVEAMGTPADQVKGAQVFARSSEATVALHSGRFDRATSAIERRHR